MTKLLVNRFHCYEDIDFPTQEKAEDASLGMVEDNLCMPIATYDTDKNLLRTRKHHAPTLDYIRTHLNLKENHKFVRGSQWGIKDYD